MRALSWCFFPRRSARVQEGLPLLRQREPGARRGDRRSISRRRSAKCKVTRFSDGESFVEIGENVRGVDAFVIQPTCSPANDNVMELLIMVDALRRASAGSITAVIPYYGYARQDRKVAPRTPITSQARRRSHRRRGRQPRRLGRPARRADPGLLQHPVRPPLRDAGLARGLPARRASTRRRSSSRPTPGGVERARAYSKRLNASLAIIDKRRERANVCEVMNLIGEVEGKDCIIIDDMIDTAGTLCGAARALAEKGAKSVVACATHGVLSGPPCSASPIRR